MEYEWYVYLALSLAFICSLLLTSTIFSLVNLFQLRKEKEANSSVFSFDASYTLSLVIGCFVIFFLSFFLSGVGIAIWVFIGSVLLSLKTFYRTIVFEHWHTHNHQNQ